MGTWTITTSDGSDLQLDTLTPVPGPDALDCVVAVDETVEEGVPLMTVQLTPRGRQVHLGAMRQRIAAFVAPGERIYIGYRDGSATRVMKAATFDDTRSELDGAPLVLRFVVHDPVWRSDPLGAPQVGGTLALTATVAAAQGIVSRNGAGQWSSPNLAGDGLALCQSGNMYFAGGAWGVAVDTGTGWVLRSTAYKPVNALCAAPSGSVYLGGAFSGGVRRFFPPSTITGLGAGIDGEVLALAINPLDGTLFVGGRFATAGGVPASRVARWNGSAWEGLGGGINGDVWTLAFSPNGWLYAGGLFTSAGGVVCNNLASWDGHVWRNEGGFSNTIHALCFGPDGVLYAGGHFFNGPHGPSSRLAMRVGRAWSGVGGGVNGSVFALAFDERGVLHVGGNFSEAGVGMAGAVYCFEGARWNGSAWFPLALDLPTTAAEIKALLPRAGGGLDIAMAWASGAALVPGITTITNIGTAACPARLTLRGPGQVYELVNLTTGAALAMTLVLLSGETVVLDTTPGRLRLVSDLRGSMLHTLVPGSDVIGFQLVPGPNRISCLMTTTNTQSRATLEYWARYWNLWEQ